jgi:RimJ/RimL family protein N-acetyltransferase
MGHATEALSAIVEIAGRLGVARLRALCHPEHRASWRVLEKCGFSRDASWARQVVFPNLAPGIPQDVLCFALVPDRRAPPR